MGSASAQMVIVMDEHGGTAGILTMEDLFEEIVGDIEEPGGLADHAEVYRDEHSVLHVAGAIRLPEVGEHLGVELEHEEVDSVSRVNEPKSQIVPGVEAFDVNVDVSGVSLESE